MKKEMILETERLFLRQLTREDKPALRRILQDEEVMYAYAHAFSEEEVEEWLTRQLERYELYGNFGLWAVVEKASGLCIGQCGLTMQDYNEQQVLEIGYLFQKAYWHKGYAIEAAIACKEYAFTVLKAKEVYSIIRDNNEPSKRVALRNGMHVCDSFVKHYYGIDMPHLVYKVENQKTETIDVKAFWDAVVKQDAQKIRTYFHKDAVIRWHNTNECFTLEEFICANCEYPDEWDGEVERMEKIENGIVTVVHVYATSKPLSFHVTSFLHLQDGLIKAVDEYWGDDGEIPSWRKQKRIGKPIR